MLEFYEPGAAIIEDTVAKTVERVNEANKRALDFMFGAQKVMLEERRVVILGRDRIAHEDHQRSALLNKFLQLHRRYVDHAVLVMQDSGDVFDKNNIGTGYLCSPDNPEIKKILRVFAPGMVVQITMTLARRSGK